MYQALFCVLMIQQGTEKTKSQISQRLYCNGSVQDVIQLPKIPFILPAHPLPVSVVLAPSSQLLLFPREPSSAEGHCLSQEVTTPLPSLQPMTDG